MVEYAQLSARAQVLRLRATAFAALQAFPLEVRRLRVLYHGYNTTFRVEAVDGRRFALRLAVTTRKTPADLTAEMAWLDALHASTDLRLPVPQHTRTGGLFTEVWCEPVGRTIPAALFAWLPGRDLDDGATPEALHEIGRITATLHRHAAGWQLPPGASLMSFLPVLSNLPDRLDEPFPEFTPARRALWAEARVHAQATHDAWWSRWRPQVQHGDIHLGNVMTFRGRLALLDFDDSGIGVPPHDLAVTTYYLGDDERLQEALLAGYESLAPLPAYTASEFQAVLAGRQLLLLDDVIATENAAIRAIVPRYVANAEVKLRHFLATGEFRHRLEGVETLW